MAACKGWALDVFLGRKKRKSRAVDVFLEKKKEK
jgi:hypothetical protein